MEFADIRTFVEVMLAICAVVVAVSGACAAAVKFWKYAHKQSEANANDINDFKMWLRSDKKRIEALEKKQDEVERQNKMQLKALLMLMSHELDGNHTAQLTSIRDEIHDYLFK